MVSRSTDHACENSPTDRSSGNTDPMRAGAHAIPISDLDQSLLEDTTNALRKTSNLLDTVLDAIPDVIGLQDTDQRIIRFNRAGYRFWGVEPDQVHGKKCYSVIGRSQPCVTCAVSEVHRTGKPAEVEKYEETIGKWLNIRAYPVFDENGHIALVIEHVRDVSRKKAVEVQLREANERLITILNSIGANIYVADLESYEILFMNKKSIDTFGNNYLEKRCYEFFRQESKPCTLCTNHLLLDDCRHPTGVHAWQAENPVTKRWYLNVDRAIQWVDGRIVKIQTFLDITEAKNHEKERQLMEKQLQQARKLEAIGTLAGGIAHDFNNLMMGIQGRASLMTLDLEAGHPCQEHVQAILDCSRSATGLTSQLLGVARGGKYEARPIDINAVILTSTALFGRTKKEIAIHTQLETPPPVVLADRKQIEQVLLNLYINAWQAMQPGGDLYLQTAVMDLDEAACRPHAVQPGRFASISVTDTGGGMDQSTREQVFDPFFTTKARGRGTGLGLASAYGIIKNHAGFITVYSRVGQGATFTIFLPLSDQAVFREAPLAETLLRGTETILLIDDETAILQVGQAMLEKLGYAVITAGSGQAGIDAVQAGGRRIDLVILDMIMPQMDGGTTFERIRRLHPALPVLLCSGYSLNGQAQRIMLNGCNGFIQKPFDLVQLSQKLRTILDAVKRATQK